MKVSALNLISRWSRLSALLVPSLAVCQAIPTVDLTKLEAEYRPSLVYLKATKVDDKGVPYDEYGTGFVISEAGHILTACHMVEKLIRGKDGKPESLTIDSVEVIGALANKESRKERMEDIEVLDCLEPPIDIALLKFKNDYPRRKPIPLGDSTRMPRKVASMGFPLGAAFFNREGLIGGVGDRDTILIDMTALQGDSGAPVFNSSMQVVGLMIGGWGGSDTRITVAKPIHYARNILNQSGLQVPFTAPPAEVTPRSDEKSESLAAVYEYPNGGYKREGSRWVEFPGRKEMGGRNFEHVQHRTDATYLYLVDKSRNVESRLPLAGGIASWSLLGRSQWTDFQVIRPSPPTQNATIGTIYSSPDVTFEEFGELWLETPTKPPSQPVRHKLWLKDASFIYLVSEPRTTSQSTPSEIVFSVMFTRIPLGGGTVEQTLPNPLIWRASYLNPVSRRVI